MTSPENIRSILVIKLRNIGDVLLTSPLFANLRLHFPGARICALVNSGTEEMLTDNPAVDRVYVYDRSAKRASLKRRMKVELGLLASLRRERFDLAINLTEGDRGAIASLVSGARLRIGMDSGKRGFKGKDRIYTSLLPPLPASMHAVDQNLRYLNALGLETLHKQVSFCFREEVRSRMEQRLLSHGLQPGQFFHAHITSRWMFKTMPPATAARLIDLLVKHSGLPCLLTSSPEQKELDYLGEVRRFLSSPGTLHFCDLTLKELGAISSLSRFFAGVDSAPMHMAAAQDIPVLGVFGPSSAQDWGPWDNRLQENPYRQPRGVQSTGRHMVLQSTLPCVACHRDGCNGSKKSDCLDFSDETLETTLRQFVAAIITTPSDK